MVNPLLNALLGLTIGQQRISPVEEERQRIIAQGARPDPNAVQPVQPDVAPIVQPDRAQPVNTSEVAPLIRPTETITAQEQAVQDASLDPQQTSDAYKSPPDLSQMYLEMMNRTMRQQQFGSAATLIAAGLAQDQNKGRLIEMAEGEGSATGQGDMFKTIYDLQTKAAEAAQKQAMRQRLPAIAKSHGLSLEDAEIMFEEGSLDEFLKEAASPDTEIVEKSDGSKALINKRTGEVIKEIGGAKARKIIQIDDPSGKGGKISVYEDDYTPVGGGAPVTKVAPPPRKQILIDDPSGKGGKISVYEDDYTRVDTGEKVTEIAPSQAVTYLDAPNGGKYAVDSQGKRLPDQDIPGTDKIEVQTLADGTKQAINTTTGQPVGEAFGPRTDISTDDMKEYAVARAAAEARGDKFPDFDQWLAQTEKTRGPKSLGTEKLTDKLGTNRADQLNTSYEQGKGSRETIDYVNNARTELEKGIIAGSEFSPLELRGRKLWADILGFGDDDEAISNTETFRASLKEVVLSKIKALGSGTAISDADRRYIDQATGGDITLNEASMRRIFDILDKGARTKIDSYNKEVDDLLATFEDPEERKEVERNLPKIRQPEAYKSKFKTKEEGGTRRSKDDLMKQYLQPQGGR